MTRVRPAVLDLDWTEAVEILFGTEALRDPGFDPHAAQFRSGADVAADLAAHFGFTDAHYLAAAAALREDEEA